MSAYVYFPFYISFISLLTWVAPALSFSFPLYGLSTHGFYVLCWFSILTCLADFSATVNLFFFISSCCALTLSAELDCPALLRLHSFLLRLFSYPHVPTLHLYPSCSPANVIDVWQSRMTQSYWIYLYLFLSKAYGFSDWIGNNIELHVHHMAEGGSQLHL